MVSYKHVFRKNSGTLDYVLEEIEPKEELYFAIFGERKVFFLENEYKTLTERLIQMMTILDKEEKDLLLSLFGFEGKKYSIKEYATKLEVSENSVIYRRDKALRKLRNPFVHQNVKSGYFFLEGLYDKKYNFVDWKSIIIDEIKVRILGCEGKVSFFDSIFEKCRISVEIEDFEDIMVHINQLDLSARSYTALLKAGITTIGDLLNIFDSLSEINDLGIISYNEILTKLREYNYKNSVNCIIKIGEKETNYELKCSSFQQMSEQIYNFIYSENPVLGLLTEYELSIGLTSYLLSKGYLFLNVLYEERYLILQELEYVKLDVLKQEFIQFIDWLQFRYNRELFCVSIILANNAIAERLIKVQPKSYEGMIKCCNVKDEKVSEFYQEFFESCRDRNVNVILVPEDKIDQETGEYIC